MEHVLKRVAVDCNLFKNANIFDKKLIINILTSTNIKKKINLMDKPYSSECDYKKKCKMGKAMSNFPGEKVWQIVPKS